MAKAVIGPLAFGFFMGAYFIGIVLTLGPAEITYRLKRVLGLLTDTDKASREREGELDKRTAQIIREQGMAKERAREQAEVEYRNDLKSATI